MKCREAEKQIQDHAAGLLSSADAVELEQHILGCVRCREERAAAAKLEASLDGLQAVVAPPLHDRIRDRIRQTDSSPRLKEKLMKIRRLSAGFGLAGVVAVALLIGGLSLAPRSAMATLKRSIVAVQQVASAKVTITWSNAEGDHQRVVWSDNHRTRDETDGEVMVYKDGKTSSDPNSDLFIGEMKPTYWTLEGTLADWEGLTPVDQGSVTLDGRTVRLVRIERTKEDGQAERWDYYLDPSTDLPVKYVNYVQTNGEWEESFVTRYEFNIHLDDHLFDLPAGKSWHEMPDTIEGKIID